MEVGERLYPAFQFDVNARQVRPIVLKVNGEGLLDARQDPMGGGEPVDTARRAAGGALPRLAVGDRGGATDPNIAALARARTHAGEGLGADRRWGH